MKHGLLRRRLFSLSLFIFQCVCFLRVHRDKSYYRVNTIKTIWGITTESRIRFVFKYFFHHQAYLTFIYKRLSGIIIILMHEGSLKQEQGHNNHE